MEKKYLILQLKMLSWHKYYLCEYIYMYREQRMNQNSQHQMSVFIYLYL